MMVFGVRNITFVATSLLDLVLYAVARRVEIDVFSLETLLASSTRVDVFAKQRGQTTGSRLHKSTSPVKISRRPLEWGVAWL